MKRVFSLTSSFTKFVSDAAKNLMTPNEHKLTDDELLKSLAYNAHHDYHKHVDYAVILKNEIERRVLSNQDEHPSLIPYAKVIAKISPKYKDDGYSIKAAVWDLTSPIYAAHQENKLQRQLDKQ